MTLNENIIQNSTKLSKRMNINSQEEWIKICTVDKCSTGVQFSERGYFILKNMIQRNIKRYFSISQKANDKASRKLFLLVTSTK